MVMALKTKSLDVATLSAWPNIISTSIPSIHDKAELACQIYNPTNLSVIQGVIFAHPYAPLGGSLEDVIVQRIASIFLSEGFVVGLFNFRGAGGSEGRTSWTGRPELSDYVSFAGFFVSYLHFLKISSSSLDRSAEICSRSGLLKLTFGGYSYGAMITAQLPPIEQIVDRFAKSALNSVESQILGKAYQQSRWLEDSESNGNSVQVAQNNTTLQSNIGISIVNLQITKVSYLLVSPLLPPLAWAVAWGFLAETFSSTKRQKDQDTKLSQLSNILVNNNTLSVYGDKDEFTSAKKLRAWSRQLQQIPESKFTKLEFHDSGHFWEREDAMERLQMAIRKWIHSDSTIL